MWLQRNQTRQELLFLDITIIKKPEGEKESIYKPNWRIVVDERTQMKFSHFFVSKNGMAEPTCAKFQQHTVTSGP
jgi:hypothetical protein